MCLICIEFKKKRMTREEVKKALPEMIQFSKTKEDKVHYEKLSTLDDNEFIIEVENFLKTVK